MTGDKTFREIAVDLVSGENETAIRNAINEVLATMTTDDYNTMMDEAISVQPLSE